MELKRQNGGRGLGGGTGHTVAGRSWLGLRGQQGLIPAPPPPDEAGSQAGGGGGVSMGSVGGPSQGALPLGPPLYLLALPFSLSPALTLFLLSQIMSLPL